MREKMWAAQLVHPGKPLEVSRIDVPRLGPGELLLKLEASGICHTDLHVMNAADFPVNAPQPMTLGHEGIGRVVEAGLGSTIAVGTRLGAPWLHDTCEQCRSCRSGWESYCTQQHAHGYNVNGAYAEYVIVKERFAAVIPNAFDSVASAPLMCAGVTAYGGVMKANLAPGRNAVIIGCGGLGQYGIQIAKQTGARVIAVDSNPAKLVEAKVRGADECFLADATTAEKILALGGADAVLNFAPSNKIWPMVTGMVNHFATIVAVAMVAEPVPLVLEWLTYNGVNITGTSVGTRQQMQDFLALVELNDIDIDIETVELANVNEALARLSKGDVKGRLVIDFSSNP